MTTLISAFESWLEKDEQWVLNFIQELKSDAAIVAADLKAAWTWIGAHAGEIQQDAAMVTNSVAIAKAAGIPIPSSVIAAVNEAQVAVASLSAAVNASSAPNSNAVTTMVAGYSAAKAAQAAVAAAAGNLVTNLPSNSASVSAQGSG